MLDQKLQVLTHPHMFRPDGAFSYFFHTNGACLWIQSHWVGRSWCWPLSLLQPRACVGVQQRTITWNYFGVQFLLALSHNGSLSQGTEVLWVPSAHSRPGPALPGAPVSEAHCSHGDAHRRHEDDWKRGARPHGRRRRGGRGDSAARIRCVLRAGRGGEDKASGSSDV